MSIHGQCRYSFLEKHRRPTPVRSPSLGLKLQRPVANDHSSMPREDAIIFSDLIGKVDMLRIESPQCDLPGQYRLADLIMRYGLKKVRSQPSACRLGGMLTRANSSTGADRWLMPR